MQNNTTTIPLNQNKMKTAMQEHIIWLISAIDLCKENAPTLVNCLNVCLSDAESRLEIEKEQIIETYNEEGD